MQILSSSSSMKYFNAENLEKSDHKILSDDDIVNVLSDIKHRIFPRPFERLAFSSHPPSRSLVGCEIGVCGDEHALSLLLHLDIAKLCLIDPYEIYADYKEGNEHYGNDQLSLGDTFESAEKLLSDHSNKIVWIHEFSSRAHHFIQEPLDFVYVDGNHQHEYITEDIQNYFPKLKKGGTIRGLDFYNGFQKDHDGVVSAVIEFYMEHREKLSHLSVELPDWWLAKL